MPLFCRFETLKLCFQNGVKDPFICFVIVGQGLKSGLACVAHGLRCELFIRWKWQVLWLNAALPPTEKQRSLFDTWAWMFQSSLTSSTHLMPSHLPADLKQDTLWVRSFSLLIRYILKGLQGSPWPHQAQSEQRSS